MVSQEFLTVLSNYRSKLGGVRTFLEDLRILRKKNEDGEDLLENLTSLEVAQVQLALAFAASSLFFSYLKTEGFNVGTHPITQDLMRVQQYMRKVATVIEQGDPPRRTTMVNAAAAKRVVTFHTSKSSTSDTRGDKLKGDKSTNDGQSPRRCSDKPYTKQGTPEGSRPGKPPSEGGSPTRVGKGGYPGECGEDREATSASPVCDAVSAEAPSESSSVRMSKDRIQGTSSNAPCAVNGAKSKRKRHGGGREHGVKRPFLRRDFPPDRARA
ncbi:sas10 utp3 c1d family protein [Cystoisospora suis]|uniref:Nuclear nucleic acid-binding protein C1D n=1 Tax=Cystoisospora suis TaxID=483139 RepID=A0A2C6KWY1_9APIC|nr:sas10 utp3 c1d family protein [Cystoisospora suis]